MCSKTTIEIGFIISVANSKVFLFCNLTKIQYKSPRQAKLKQEFKNWFDLIYFKYNTCTLSACIVTFVIFKMG